MRFSLRSLSLGCGFLVALFLFLQGCGPRYSSNVRKIEEACAQVAAKHAVALQGNVHEVIFPGEWPAAIEGENPKAVEVFDDSVWVFLKRKTGDVAEGFVLPGGRAQDFRHPLPKDAGASPVLFYLAPVGPAGSHASSSFCARWKSARKPGCSRKRQAR